MFTIVGSGTLCVKPLAKCDRLTATAADSCFAWLYTEPRKKDPERGEIGSAPLYLPLAQRICADEGVTIDVQTLLSIINSANGSFRNVVLNVSTAARRTKRALMAQTLAAAAIQSAAKPAK